MMMVVVMMTRVRVMDQIKMIEHAAAATAGVGVDDVDDHAHDAF
jgi:hypothetical protein